MPTGIPYRYDLKKIAQTLRKNSTKSEIKLWKALRKKRLGIDFNRQKPLGNYIVDFYNVEFRLAIEIDGDSHELKGEYDYKRQEDLYKFGVTILRFTNEQIEKDLQSVIVEILNCIKHPGLRQAQATPLGKRG
jgi:very-short-patch-repair endonuclease